MRVCRAFLRQLAILTEEVLKHRFRDADDIFVLRHGQAGLFAGPEPGALDEDGAVVGQVEGWAGAVVAASGRDDFRRFHLHRQ